MRAFSTSLVFATLALAAAQEAGGNPLLRRRAADSSMDCSVYTTTSTNCANCGACFNPGARPGVKCSANGGVGYFCAADATPGATFACMDWSFASSSMKAAEEAFKARTGNDVYLGVGTYGVDNDQQRGLGNCYRMTVEGVDRDIIAQSINTGSDVAGNQFGECVCVCECVRTCVCYSPRLLLLLVLCACAKRTVGPTA
jgi:hypothetical protein